MPEPVFINGKFAAQRVTGVQRFAGQLVQALDATAVPGEHWVLLLPPQATAPPLQRIELRRVGRRAAPLHLWEQVALPLAARGGLLLNLAGSAPVLAGRQWCTFHDAAVFDHPDAFTPAFRRWYRFHFTWLARHAQRLLTVSEHSRGRLVRHLPVSAAGVGVVPNGCDHLLPLVADTGAAQRLGLHGLRWVLAVGSDSPLKNWASLLRAWAGCAPPADSRLVLVGGRDAAVFAGSGATGLLPAQALHAGPVGDSTLKALMQGAVALIMPSLDEGFGLPPLEAMSLGCPVAVARAGALPEVCGPAALYFDPRQPAELTAALSALLSDAAQRERLVALGHARARMLTWAHAASRLRQELAEHGGAA